jgi:hypothetical protein
VKDMVALSCSVAYPLGMCVHCDGSTPLQQVLTVIGQSPPACQAHTAPVGVMMHAFVTRVSTKSAIAQTRRKIGAGGSA